MTASQDTEITLGTGKLLVLFFSLVAICALFFALGYSLGRKSEPGITTASAATLPQLSASTAKTSSGAAAAPMSFYKSVEQKSASPDLTPAPDAKTDTPTPGAPASAADANTTLPTSGYFVQVAAVSKPEDADALVDALKKKQYPAFVAAQGATDKLFRVQVGPFGEIKDAEAMRTHLIADGYSPIVKK
jgi:DedD protein